MTVTNELVDEIRGRIGDSAPPIHAHVDRLTAQRYARAIGDGNPLYFDEEYARSLGYERLLVPWNFLPSCLDWTEGGPNDDLRVDGTRRNDMGWIPVAGVRLMGGGEQMTFHRPVYVDTDFVLTSHLDDAQPRDSRQGLMVVMRLRNTYATAAGDPLLTSTRTVLGR